MSTFSIASPPKASLSVQQGSAGPLTFSVTNGSDSFHNLGLRVAVLNAVGEEDPGAASASWFSVQGPTDSFVPAGGVVECVVTATVPNDAALAPVSFALIAFDSDLADEDFSRGQPVTLTVTEKVEEAVAKPGIPMWVWFAVGGGALAVIIAIVAIAASQKSEPDDVVVTDDDDSAVVVVDDDDSEGSAAAGTARELQILFKAFEGRDPLTGPLEGVLIKMESTISPTQTVKTNVDGDGSMKLCVVEDPSAATDVRCLKVMDSFSMYAQRTGYKNSPTTTLKVDDLIESPKTYVQMVKASSGSKPTRPVVVPKEELTRIPEYFELNREKFEVPGGLLDLRSPLTKPTAGPEVFFQVDAAEARVAAKILSKYTDAASATTAVKAASQAPARLPDLSPAQMKALTTELQAQGIEVRAR